jgi:hypothetical protein
MISISSDSNLLPLFLPSSENSGWLLGKRVGLFNNFLVMSIKFKRQEVIFRPELASSLELLLSVL